MSIVCLAFVLDHWRLYSTIIIYCSSRRMHKKLKFHYVQFVALPRSQMNACWSQVAISSISIHCIGCIRWHFRIHWREIRKQHWHEYVRKLRLASRIEQACSFLVALFIVPPPLFRLKQNKASYNSTFTIFLWDALLLITASFFSLQVLSNNSQRNETKIQCFPCIILQ